MCETFASFLVGLFIIGPSAYWLWHRYHRKPAEDADMQDWQLDLRRSAALGDLAQHVYVAHCAWMRIRPDWTALPHARRQQIRKMATEMLERLAQS